MTYPAVLSEAKTLDLVLQGRSLARYGDGEFKMARRVVGIKSQAADKTLTRRLAEILHDSGDCLVGIPNIHAVLTRNPDPSKVSFWAKQLWASEILRPGRVYASSLITRPDSAPWLTGDATYWSALESLWIGQDVTLVRGSTKSLVAEDLVGAREVREIVAPRQHAWSEYEALLERIGTPKRALLCLGPTATVMAVDLCKKGVHAIDLGHVGMFRRKYLRGDLLVVTDEDKAVDQVPA